MSDDRPPPDAEVYDRVFELVGRWLAEQPTHNPVVTAVDTDPGPPPRWFARVNGEAKDVYSLWFSLRQRTLHVETFVCPAPAHNAAEFYRQLLVRNRSLFGLSFSVGEEEAIFLQAEIPLEHVDERRLDEIFGSVYEAIERCFGVLVRVGFAPPRD